MPATHPDLIWPALAKVAVGWLVLCWAHAVLSGWRRLARNYKATEAFPGATWRRRRIFFRYLAPYSWLLIVGTDPKGLYLAVILPYRFGHPPLFIPWEAIRRAHFGLYDLLPVSLEVGDAYPVRISVDDELASEFESSFGRRIPEVA